MAILNEKRPRRFLLAGQPPALYSDGNASDSFRQNGSFRPRTFHAC